MKRDGEGILVFVGGKASTKERQERVGYEGTVGTEGRKVENPSSFRRPLHVLLALVYREVAGAEIHEEEKSADNG